MVSLVFVDKPAGATFDFLCVDIELEHDLAVEA
jgi:hypothetical protein